jgi:hypothetical protein
MKRSLFTVLTALGVVSIAPAVFAQPPHAAAASNTDQPAYSYEFTDESVLGDGANVYGTTISSYPSHQRTLLIRPRVQFIAEMLKSVEML